MKQPDYNHGGVKLYHGDCVEVMRSMAACSVDTIITDPPYHLTQTSRNGSARRPGTGPFGRVHVGERGFMGKTWDGGGIAFDPVLSKNSIAPEGRLRTPGLEGGARFCGARNTHCALNSHETAGEFPPHASYAASRW